MEAAKHDIQQRRDADEGHNYTDIPKPQAGRRTKIVNSREYVKRLKRQHHRHCQVFFIIFFCHAVFCQLLFPGCYNKAWATYQLVQIFVHFWNHMSTSTVIILI